MKHQIGSQFDPTNQMASQTLRGRERGMRKEETQEEATREECNDDFFDGKVGLGL